MIIKYLGYTNIKGLCAEPRRPELRRIQLTITSLLLNKKYFLKKVGISLLIVFKNKNDTNKIILKVDEPEMSKYVNLETPKFKKFKILENNCKSMSHYPLVIYLFLLHTHTYIYAQVPIKDPNHPQISCTSLLQLASYFTFSSSSFSHLMHV